MSTPPVSAEAAEIIARDGVVIVGAGQAGGRCAEALRQAGFTGAITLVGHELHLPYERPSLSKEMLLSDGEEPIAWVRPEDAYAAEGVELRLGSTVVALDRARREATLHDGSTLNYGALVLATGARPRRLNTPGAERVPLHYIRTLEDSRALRERLGPSVRLAIIGAGFIGLEVAAAARTRGAEVVVIEAADRIMARAVPPEISEHHLRLHRDKGVSIMLGAGLAGLEPGAGGGGVLRTDGGDRFTADLVVVGVGIEPNDELAREAGLPTERGVVVDEFGRTADPMVFAAGDVARHYNPLLGRHILLESWQNAQNQAIAVARTIAGGSAPYAEIPWFWSDQFGVNLQVTGLAEPGCRTLIRGTPGQGPALVLQLRDGRLASAAALDASRDLRFAKELILSGAVLDEAALAAPDVRLADLLREVKQRKAAA